MTRDEIIERIDRSWDAWTAALDGIPPERSSEPGVCGYFSVKDLIGHIAFWDEQDLARAHKLARGEEVQPNDWATMNDREYEAHKDDTLEAQTARMIAAHARLSADVRTLDRLDALKLDDTWDHYDAHRDDILAWRAAQGV
jgi:hypothetical protein